MNDDVLKHYGVKGMRWGVRQKALPRNAKRVVKVPPELLTNPAPGQKLTRGTRRWSKKEAKRIEDMFNQALAKPYDLILLNDKKKIMSGKEFIDYVKSNGSMAVNYNETRLLATYDEKRGHYYEVKNGYVTKKLVR